MKNITITEPNTIGYASLPKPKLGKGEILLKVKRVGYCGTDLNTFRGLNPLVSYPRIPGHEIGAIIEELGDDVPDGFLVGQKATVIPYTNCGHCSACLKGRINACKNNQTLGVQRDGALTEYIAVPHEKVIVSANLSLAELALVEPLAVGFHAVDRARIEQNDTVAIFGAGMIGLGAVSASGLQRKAKVIAIDIDDAKLRLARKAGASDTINSRKENLSERLADLTHGHGPDVMIEAVGIPSTFQACIEEVGYAGRVVYIGYAKDSVIYETKNFILKELDIMGSRGSTLKDFQEVISMLAAGRYPVEETLTKTVPFEDGASAMEHWNAKPSSITKIQILITT